MASYLGIYTNDIKVQYPNVILQTFIFTEGTRSPTSYERDSSVLPNVFKESVRRLDEISERIAVCNINYPTIRVAQCFISDNVYYQIPCPFIGGTQEIKSFFKELTDNSQFRLVNLRGEKLPYSYNLIFSNVLK